WRLADNKTLWISREHEAEVRCLAFSPDGQRLVTGGTERVIRVFDSRLPEPTWQGGAASVRGAETLPAEPTLVPAEPRTGLAVTADGRGLATTRAKDLRVWGTSSGPGLGHVEVGDDLRSAAFSPDGQWVVAGTARGPIHVWEAGTGKPLRVLEGHNAPITALTVASLSVLTNARVLLASGSCRGQDVWLWDVAS